MNRAEALRWSGWRHLFDVIAVLVGREFSSRYKQTALGVSWSLISPLLYLATFYLLFKVVMRFDIPHYASFAFIGILTWGWFQSALLDAVGSITRNPGLVSQPGFPLVALPIVSVVTTMVNFLVALPVLALLMAIDGVPLGVIALVSPLIIAVQFTFTLAAAYVVAAADVYFRDIRFIIPALLQIGYFLTPVFYDATKAPERLRFIYDISPMSQLVDAFRAVLLYGQWPNVGALLLVWLCALALLALALRYFTAASHRFLEEL